jgi:hypothetical protein
LLAPYFAERSLYDMSSVGKIAATADFLSIVEKHDSRDVLDSEFFTTLESG